MIKNQCRCWGIGFIPLTPHGHAIPTGVMFCPPGMIPPTLPSTYQSLLALQNLMSTTPYTISDSPSYISLSGGSRLIGCGRGRGICHVLTSISISLGNRQGIAKGLSDSSNMSSKGIGWGLGRSNSWHWSNGIGMGWGQDDGPQPSNRNNYHRNARGENVSTVGLPSTVRNNEINWSGVWDAIFSRVRGSSPSPTHQGTEDEV